MAGTENSVVHPIETMPLPTTMSTTSTVTDENEGDESVDVEVKISRVTWKKLKSTGKGFIVRGRQITAWVKNVHDCRLTLDVKNSQTKQILNEIGSGKMAKDLEKLLKSLTNVSGYEKIKVKLQLIKTVQDADANNQREKVDSHHGHSIAGQTWKSLDAERAARLMDIGLNPLAFTLLKQSLEGEMEEVPRLQKLIRLSICAMNMNKPREFEEAFPEILMLMQKVHIPDDEIDIFEKDFTTMHQLLLTFQNAIRAIEILFAIVEIAKRISDVVSRLKMISRTLSCISMTAKHLLTTTEPGACLRSEMMRCMKKVKEEIKFVANQTDCDTHLRARRVYLAEYILAEAKVVLETQTAGLFRTPSREFKNSCSHWADMPFTIVRLRLHPETATFFNDQEFKDTIHEISEKPALLQQRMTNPKIAYANKVLTSDFGIFSRGKESNNATSRTSSLEPETCSPSFAGTVTAPNTVDKEESQKEKEIGNEAYKKKQFQNALSHYEKAVSFDPTNALLHSNKAAVYISLEKFDKARASCLKATSLAQSGNRHGNIDVAKITARLARVEYLDKHPDIALTLYQRSLHLHFDPRVQEDMDKCERLVHALIFLRFPFVTGV